MAADDVGSLQRHSPLQLMLALGAVVAVGLAFHLPGLSAPLSVHDQNAGWYFGVAANAYRDLGFWELRGLPIWLQRPVGIGDALYYQMHPPGVFWLMALFGTDESSLRIPGVVGGVLAGCFGFQLLLGRLGFGAALAFGLVLVLLPSVAYFCLISYEPVVLALGLALWVSTSELLGACGLRRAFWLSVQGLVCLVGPWADWPFMLYCVATTAIVWRGTLAGTLRVLARPAALATLSVAAHFAWRTWSLAAPGLRTDIPLADFWMDLRSRFSEAVSPGLLLPHAVDLLAATATWPVLVCGALGLIGWMRAAPWRGEGPRGASPGGAAPAATPPRRFPLDRLLLASAFAGVGLLWPAMFMTHSLGHPHFYVYADAALAAGACALAGLLRGRSSSLVVALPWALVATVAIASVQARGDNATSAFREFARVASAAGRDPRTGELVPVLTNARCVFPYYARLANVVSTPVGDVDQLSRLRGQATGFRYLWCVGATDPGLQACEPRLSEFLATFPKERQPELERAVAATRQPPFPGLREVWLVSVPPEK